MPILPLLLLLLSVVDASRVLLVHLHTSSTVSLDRSSTVERQTVRDLLANSVEDVQNSVMQYILAQGNVDIHPLWLQNTLVVRVDEETEALSNFFNQLQWFPGVEHVEEDSTVLRLLETTPGHAEEQNNVKLLHAPQLWAAGAKGKNVVVANIDSGVRYTHEALKENFRGTKGEKAEFDYSFWFTPGTDMSKETPDTADVVGHGTHTMGTAVGSKGIGIAPEATWITARAFDERGAANKSDFLLAAQWVLCPTKTDGTGEDCSLGANVVTNSYGVDRSTPEYPSWTWLSKVIDTWRAAGVYPVFASGNTNGFLCGSVYYPGSRADTIAVGALMGGRALWGASGKGPSTEDATSLYGEVLADQRIFGSKYIIKPDFVAPGFAIRSALSGGDTLYTRLTGTSMSTPHVAGAIALLLSVNSTSPPPVEKVLKSLSDTTTRNMRKPFLVPSACGNTTYQEYPNNIYGWGLPNVCAAAEQIGFHCSDNLDNLKDEPQSIATSDIAAVE